MTTTTVRVTTQTRDRLTALSRRRAVTVDGVIQAGIEALEWQEVRSQARADAERLAADPADLELTREVLADMDALRAR